MKKSISKQVQDFCKNYRITEKQFLGEDTVGGYLYLGSVTSIPKGFNPTVGGDLYLGRLTSIPEGFNPTVGGNLDLGSLTSIPEGFNPTVGGYLDLRSLTSIPEGFNPTVGGNLYLGRLTSIPEGFNPTVGGNLYLGRLTSIPEGFNPTVGGYLDLGSLTSIPEGFNKEAHQYKEKETNLLTWQKGKYIKADGRFSEVISKKGNVYKLKDVNKKNEYYLVTYGNGKYSHGETIKQAKEDLIYKIKERNKEQFKGIDVDKKLPFAECVEMYRVITGACSTGTKHFIESTGVQKKKYSVNEIIKMTKGQYGHDQFASFFK